jgi:hypothetical protein
MNCSLRFDNRKTYVIDMVTHVIFTPGFDDPLDALNKALEINNIPTPPSYLQIAVGTITGVVLNRLGYRSTLPHQTFIHSRTN